MTPTTQARDAGLDGIPELEKRSGVIRETLRNWFKNRRWVFDACVEKAAREKNPIEPVNARDDLFELTSQEYELSLIESELDSIIYCVLGSSKIKITGEKE